MIKTFESGRWKIRVNDAPAPGEAPLQLIDDLEREPQAIANLGDFSAEQLRDLIDEAMAWRKSRKEEAK